mmetsp:Transcript_88407/g.270587  ORF Transcript_88407/g.270587 Transcript_88407/m.270587 type:complete len:251 (-) Transcript_88407:238-990(-)
MRIAPSEATLSKSASRVSAASAEFASYQVPICGYASCAMWWIQSPVMTAEVPFDSMTTPTWPGVWPSVGTKRTLHESSSTMTWSELTKCCKPASTIGCKLSRRMVAKGAKPSSPLAFTSSKQDIHSFSATRYFALGKVGTHTPSRKTVLKPTWSKWRCVHKTKWMDSGSQPAACRFCKKGPCFIWNFSWFGPRLLSSPMHVSTAMRVPPGVSMTNIWTASWRLPSPSMPVGGIHSSARTLEHTSSAAAVS